MLSKRWFRVLIFGVVAAALAGGAWLMVRQIKADRQALLDYRRRPESVRPAAQSGSNVKTYTGEELEQARRSGQLPAGAAPAAQAAQPGNQDAQIQRTLRTLEEINRINEMNRRMMEQQQRMQQQQNQRQ